jgi:5-methylcytosine-specific restriction endonuclease McrA
MAPPRRVTVAPLSTGTYKLQLTISAATHDKLRRVRDLLRHSIPTGDMAEVLDRALALLLQDLERRRCAAAARPRGSVKTKSHGRHIPAAVKREVWRRDDGRCAFSNGSRRCTETAFLEFHHVVAYADGGAATVANIELRCRAHNQYEAALLFTDVEEMVRETAAAW